MIITISELKNSGRLPKSGMKVKTVCDPTMRTESFFVKSKNLVCRRDDEGVYYGWVPGAGGDVWWVQHSNGDVGAYCFTEVFDL